jgi:hypothetical protein
MIAGERGFDGFLVTYACAGLNLDKINNLMNDIFYK